MKKEFLELGQIVGTHGVRGEVRVQPWCDSPDFARQFSEVYIDGARVRVLSCRPHGNVVLMRLEGIGDLDEAAASRGKIIRIRRDDVSLPENTWFIEELIGCRVSDADVPEKCYGTLSEVSQTGANDVWHITDAAGKTRLIPAIRDVVIRTDVENNEVFIRPLKGIFDDAD